MKIREIRGQEDNENKNRIEKERRKMSEKKNKQEIIAKFKKALEHKKEWQQHFVQTYAAPGMKVEFF